MRRRACYLPVLNVGASNDPLVGRTELAGLVLATGHSCWGISNAPGTGKAISELIFEGQISCINAASLDPRMVR
jgi:glycine/D-amino acid oxidase-like deaminating enzyme